MPSVVRDHRPAAGVPPSGDDLRQLRERALVVLLDASLEPVVELVAWAQPPWVHVATARGAARVRLDHPGGPYEVLHGVDPLAGQDPLALVPPAAEQGTPRPRGAAQHYPHAAVRLASLFSAGGRSPDIAVVHTDAHHWPERGGHLGEHGSLGVLQSRAPFLLSGVGVGPRGVLADSARTVDVMPTLARLAGVTAAPLDGLEGRARLDLVTPLDPPAYVVGLLWDGANAQDLYDLATRGELPAVARLLDRGCALAGGAVAEFPSVTLVNHASALTGVGPGRHGIVHNVFYDRDRGEQLIANDAGTWHQACDLLRPGVTTLWEEVARARPEAMTVCVNEPVDRGAGYSTFGMVRARGGADGARGLGGELPGAEEDPHATAAAVAASPDYRWSTQVDRLGLQQVLALWGDGVPPALTWWNTTLTDTGHHEGGPRSEVARASLRDSDRRLGAWLDVLERRGLTDRVVVLLTADHGMAAADPACSGDWDDALRSAGVPFRDEGYGFLYLGV